MKHGLRSMVVLACMSLAGTGCQYGLRDVDPELVRPYLSSAFESSGSSLDTALNRSRVWLESEQSIGFFPLQHQSITRSDVLESVNILQECLRTSESTTEFCDLVLQKLKPMEAVGATGQGDVLFTAYYVPAFEASRERTSRFRYPLYRIGDWIRGGLRRGRVWSEYSRRAIEEEGLLDGMEIAWLPDRLQAYMIHVNGSALLNMTDGTTVTLAHSATNNMPYSSLGKMLLEKLPELDGRMNMEIIETLHQQQPDLVAELMLRNDRFVFFEQVDQARFPRGGLGIPLVPEVSMAADHAYLPPGCPVLVVTELKDGDDAVPFRRIMVDQDSGGAIKSPGRADLFLGIGPEAGDTAGQQTNHGRMWYLLPR